MKRNTQNSGIQNTNGSTTTLVSFNVELIPISLISKRKKREAKKEGRKSRMNAMRVMCATMLAVILCVSFLPLISSHVALTYPPARKYDLDFLDNSRTKGPCGMPKGERQPKFFSTSIIHLTSSSNDSYKLFIYRDKQWIIPTTLFHGFILL